MRALVFFLTLCSWTFLRAENITASSLEEAVDFHPEEATILVPFKAPIIIDGEKAGEMQLPAGRTFPVKSISDGMVVVLLGQSGETSVRIEDTDAVERANAIAAEPSATPAVVEATATPTPVATPTPEATPAPTPETTHAFAERLTGDLVHLERRQLVPLDPATLKGKNYIVLYHSAMWCGPCRSFTPELIRFYRRHRSRLDQFEILFVSNDRSEEEMLKYMIDDRMPWPAISYPRLKTRHPVHDFKVTSIPCLIILDQSGQPLPELQVGENYIGTRKALALLDKKLRE